MAVAGDMSVMESRFRIVMEGQVNGGEPAQTRSPRGNVPSVMEHMSEKSIFCPDVSSKVWNRPPHPCLSPLKSKHESMAWSCQRVVGQVNRSIIVNAK